MKKALKTLSPREELDFGPKKAWGLKFGGAVDIATIERPQIITLSHDNNQEFNFNVFVKDQLKSLYSEKSDLSKQKKTSIFHNEKIINLDEIDEQAQIEMSKNESNAPDIPKDEEEEDEKSLSYHSNHENKFGQSNKIDNSDSQSKPEESSGEEEKPKLKKQHTTEFKAYHEDEKMATNNNLKNENREKRNTIFVKQDKFVMNPNVPKEKSAPPPTKKLFVDEERNDE